MGFAEKARELEGDRKRGVILSPCFNYSTGYKYEGDCVLSGIDVWRRGGRGVPNPVL
jgi:hypothetical protein